MDSIEQIINNSNFIVDSYAYVIQDSRILCVNLCNNHRAEFQCSGLLVSTTMDDIEVEIAKSYLERNMCFIEDERSEAAHAKLLSF